MYHRVLLSPLLLTELQEFQKLWARKQGREQIHISYFVTQGLTSIFFLSLHSPCL